MTRKKAKAPAEQVAVVPLDKEPIVVDGPSPAAINVDKLLKELDARDREVKAQADKWGETAIIYVGAILVIFTVTVLGCIFDPERQGVYMAFAGMVLPIFAAQIRSNDNLKKHVNSQMEDFKREIKLAFIARGRKEGREEQRLEDAQAEK